MDRAKKGPARQLVMGIGNLLLGDEGVGVHAAQALMRETLPGGTCVLDTGTAVLEAMDELETADRVIVMDAMQADGAPGSVYRVALGDCRQSGPIGSLHGFDIQRVMALAGRTDFPEVIVIGMEPGTIDWSMDLSPAVSDGFPRFLNAVRREMASGCHSA